MKGPSGPFVICGEGCCSLSFCALAMQIVRHVHKGESMIRRSFPSVAFILCLGLAVAVAPIHADAQDGSLSDILGGLLRGTGSEVEPADTRRVPFSREEMQLSFAPLVRETAPAVVNVYASQQVRARSPFAGDPFFEQFFGRRMPPRVRPATTCGCCRRSSASRDAIPVAIRLCISSCASTVGRASFLPAWTSPPRWAMRARARRLSTRWTGAPRGGWPSATRRQRKSSGQT